MEAQSILEEAGVLRVVQTVREPRTEVGVLETGLVPFRMLMFRQIVRCSQHLVVAVVVVEDDPADHADHLANPMILEEIVSSLRRCFPCQREGLLLWGAFSLPQE